MPKICRRHAGKCQTAVLYLDICNSIDRRYILFYDNGRCSLCCHIRNKLMCITHTSADAHKHRTFFNLAGIIYQSRNLCLLASRQYLIFHFVDKFFNYHLIFLPYSMKHFCRWSGHINMIVIRIILDGQISAPQMHQNFIFCLMI